MDYAKIIIDAYTKIGWVETQCGGCGLDHMSALRAEYPAIFFTESEFQYAGVPHVHGEDDLIKYLDFDHDQRSCRWGLCMSWLLRSCK